MNRSEINRDDLVFTDKGTPVHFKKDQIIDKLVVLDYVGKQWVRSREIFEPIYEVLCECGRTELRRHTYLWRDDISVNGKCCYECAKKNSGNPIEGSKRGRKRGRPRKHPIKIVKNDEYYEKIVKKIWELPICQVMSKSTVEIKESQAS